MNNEDLNWSDVESSNLAAVAYANEELFVRFKNKNVFRYDRVPQEVYDGLINADSKGSYFAQNIKGKYASNQVASEDTPEEEQPGAKPPLPDFASDEAAEHAFKLNGEGKLSTGDISRIVGTGKDGAITVEDVEKAAEAAKNPDTAADAETAPPASGGGDEPKATIRVNGGEPVDAFSEEGLTALKEAAEKLKQECLDAGVDPVVTFDGGPEMPFFSEEAMAAFDALEKGKDHTVEIRVPEGNGDPAAQEAPKAQEAGTAGKARDLPSAPPRLPPAEPESKPAGIAKVADSGNQLFITFHDGRIYRYDGLPRRYAQGIILAGDRDEYWRREIESKYKPAVMEKAA